MSARTCLNNAACLSFVWCTTVQRAKPAMHCRVEMWDVGMTSQGNALYAGAAW